MQFELSAPIDMEAEATDIVDHVAYAFAPADYLEPESSDTYQMLASCTASGCPRAMLVYPAIDEVIPVGSSPQLRQCYMPNRLGGRDVLFTATALDIRELASTGINAVIDSLNQGVKKALSSS